MPIYDVETGRIVGRVRRLLVDPDERRVVGLLLAGRLGKEAHCLPFRELHAIGEHAVTVRGTDGIAPLSEQPELAEVLRSRRRLYHAPILSEGGRFLGDVDEFTVNPRSGRIEALILSGGLIRDLFRGQAVLPAHLVLTIGEDAIIVRDQAVSHLEPRPRDAGDRRSARREDAPGPGSAGDDHPDKESPHGLSPGQRLRAALTGWRNRRTGGSDNAAHQENGAGETAVPAPSTAAEPGPAPAPASAPAVPAPTPAAAGPSGSGRATAGEAPAPAVGEPGS